MNTPRQLARSERLHLWGSVILCALVDVVVLCGVWLAVSAAFGQTSVVVVGSPHAAVTQTPNRIASSNLGSNIPLAESTRANLQAQLDQVSVYPRFFPGTTVSLNQYFLDSTITIPNGRAGERWTGPGVSALSGTLSKHGAHICLRADRHGTRFDGSSKTASATDAAGTVLVVPTGTRLVTERDVRSAVEITGGTNFAPGWYAIVGVDTENNTWTLDRDCTDGDGGDASAMTGWYCPTLHRNHGYGTVYENLAFHGQRSNTDTEYTTCAIHVSTLNDSGNFQTGKHVFRNLNVEKFIVAFLFGRDLREASLTAGTASGGADYSWTGFNDLHADLCSGSHIKIHGTKCGFLIRCQQSVGHDYEHVEVTGLDGAAFYCDSGGKLSVTGLDLGGGVDNTRQCVLRVGPQCNWGHGPHTFRRVGFDAGGNTRNPQLIVTDWHNIINSQGNGEDRLGDFIFDGVSIARHAQHNFQQGVGPYLIDVASEAYVVVRDGMSSPTALWPNCIRMRLGTVDMPRVKLERMRLDITDSPSELIDEAVSPAGGILEWEDCTKADGTPIADGSYTTQ